MSESNARTMILKMLAEGKISVDESERLLNAINRENKERNDNPKKENSSEEGFPSIPFLEATKFGLNIKNIAQTVHNTVNQAIKQVEPRRKDLKEKMREFGDWMEEVVETMAAELANHNGLPADSMSVDFIVPTPKGIESCKYFIIENIYGEIHLNTGSAFKLLINGQVSKQSIGELQSSEWFANNGIKIIEDRMYIGVNSNKAVKAIIDIHLTLPENTKVICKTVNSTIKIKGLLDIDSIQSVSGNIKLENASLSNSEIETVSGVMQFENLVNVEAQINTTSGDLAIKNSDLKRLKITSASGDVTLSEPSIALGTEVKIATTSGDINVEKSRGPWKSIDAISRNGDLRINWKGESTPVTSQKVTVKSGGEGATFYAESVSGNITFR